MYYQSGFRLTRDLPASDAQLLELKEYVTTPTCFFFEIVSFFLHSVTDLTSKLSVLNVLNVEL